MSREETIFMLGFVIALMGCAILAAVVSAVYWVRSDSSMEQVRPGDRVRDKISGAKGIVVCRAEWQYGCVRLTVQPEEHKDGKPAEPFVIDEAQAEVVLAQAVPDTRQPEKPRAHGDRPAATRPAESSRP